MDRVGTLLSLFATAFVLQTADGQLDYYWTKPVDYYGLNHAEKRLFVELHNQERANVRAAGMPFLRWVPDLELVALTIADTCSLDTVNHDIYSQYGALMETYKVFPEHFWYNQPNQIDTDTVRMVMDRWISSKDNYDLDTNTCAESTDCSPYAQVVHSSSIYFGCAYVACAHLWRAQQMLPNDASYLFVCIYDVDIHNQTAMPGPPYQKSGAACVDCPEGYTSCFESLCRTDIEYCKDVQQYCYGDTLVNRQYCDCQCADEEDHMDVYCRPNTTGVWQNGEIPFRLPLRYFGSSGEKAKSSVLSIAALLLAALSLSHI